MTTRQAMKVSKFEVDRCGTVGEIGPRTVSCPVFWWVCNINTRLTFAGKSDTSLDDRFFFFLLMLSFGCTDDVLTSHLLEYVFYKLSNEPTQRALRRSVRAL